MATTFSNKCEILATLYANHRQDPEFLDFAEFNDLGLPLANVYYQGLCDLRPEGTKYIEETWELFLELLDVEDTGFENINQIVTSA